MLTACAIWSPLYFVSGLSISRLNIARALGEYFFQSTSASAKSWVVSCQGVNFRASEVSAASGKPSAAR
jgi:hypothetical protein